MAKAEAYLGFAIKKRSVVKGFNAISYEKRVYLLILCATASENAQKEAKSLAKKFSCPLLLSKTRTVEDLVHKENCKLIAVTDQGLARAISEHTESDFDFVREETSN